MPRPIGRSRPSYQRACRAAPYPAARSWTAAPHMRSSPQRQARIDCWRMPFFSFPSFSDPPAPRMFQAARKCAPLHRFRWDVERPNGTSGGANLHLPGDLVVGIGKVGAEIASLYRRVEMPAEHGILITKFVECRANSLADHTTRA